MSPALEKVYNEQVKATPQYKKNSMTGFHRVMLLSWKQWNTYPRLSLS